MNQLTEPQLILDTNTIQYQFNEKENQKTVTKMVGTQLYMSPELHDGKKSYNFKVDIYSLGLIFFELIVPYATQSERVVLLTRAKQSNFPDDYTDLTNDFIDLMKWMLKFNPDDRPSTEQLLNDPLTKRILLFFLVLVTLIM
ncbi:hypothetical protein MXB_1416 [Myxobolus squamalis]|nr:hypothetical protein MXB_1416 [Myxobolus squamalis]